MAQNLHLHVQHHDFPENGQKNPLICLPGALGTAESDFAGQIQGVAFASSVSSVISFDPRGIGKSQCQNEDTFNRFAPLDFLETDAHDAVRVMDALGHDKFSVLGWSDGANSAAILAAKYPERVDRLILVAGNSFISEEDMEIFEKVKDISNWSEKMRNSLSDVYGADKLQEMWSGWYNTMCKMYESGGDVCCQYLPLIKCKTLIIQGGEDSMVEPFHAEYFSERIMHARLEFFDDGKHNVHIQHEEKFNQLVKAFLQEPDDKLTQSREFVSMPPKK